MLLRGTPPEVFQARDGTAVIVVQPALPQRLQSREGAAIRWALGGPPPLSERIAVCPDLTSEGLALARILGQARLVRTETVARLPFRWHVLLHPGRGGGAELVERLLQGFQHTLHTMEGTDGGQDRGGIGPLGAPGFEPAARFAGGQKRIEKALASLMRQEGLPKIVQQGAITARLMQVETKGLFPVHTAPDRIGRLAVGEPLAILPHHDQRQTPGGHFDGTARGGREISTELILIERAALCPQIAREVALGKGGPHCSRRHVGNRG